MEMIKSFGTVVDRSDHLYSAQNSAMNQPPNHWADKIRQDCEILKEHLPETIFVRAYEDRKDSLRAVIIGPEGTPFHDGLFFFDVCFPSNYPDSPPLVCSHNFVLGVNPNLNNCGEDQIFLMYTTAALENTWVPGHFEHAPISTLHTGSDFEYNAFV